MVPHRFAPLLALLEGALDWAAPSLIDYQDCLGSDRRFALGHLVWPAQRLDELAEHCRHTPPFSVSCLLEHPSQVELAERFNQRRDLPHKIDCLEILWSDSLELNSLSGWGYWLFFEVGPAQAAEAAASLTRSCWGLKLRYGDRELQPLVRACHLHGRPYQVVGKPPTVDLMLAAALDWRHALAPGAFNELLGDEPEWHADQVRFQKHCLGIEEIRQFRARAWRSWCCADPLHSLQSMMPRG